MASFTTRVEVHGGDSNDYESLHAAMEAEGFSRTITSNDGITYRLPTAEYNRSGEITRDRVLESAKRASERIQKKCSILVTESDGRTWSNLTKIE